MIAPNMGPTNSLSIGDALFGATRQRVLAVLFGRPDQRYFINELVRHAGGGKGAVQREVERLASCGLVDVATEGRQRYVQASRASPVFAEIEALVRKTFGVADVLRNALASLAARMVYAGIYGSVARGTAHARSDIDLLVVGDVDYLALSALLVEPEIALGRAINPTVFTRDDWSKRLRERSGFAQDILRHPMITLHGNTDELGEPREDRKPARTARRSSGVAAAAGRGPAKPRRRTAARTRP
jgi:predicted nucleotidyltransferase